MKQPKYLAEFILRFRAIDRFIYRAADLIRLQNSQPPPSLKRLDECTIYLLCARPRISIEPGSIETSAQTIRLSLTWKAEGSEHQASVVMPREFAGPSGASLEASPYPHRELVAKDKEGSVIGYTLFANYVQLFPSVPANVRALKVLYVGKGVHDSVQDRLKSHSTLQQMLADLGANHPDLEVFVLALAFGYQKDLLATKGVVPEVVGREAERVREKALALKPSREEQASLAEATAISYFRPEYNTHYVNFPLGHERILRPLVAADIAAIVVELDNSLIADQQVYSDAVAPNAMHMMVADLRALEGRWSYFKSRE